MSDEREKIINDIVNGRDFIVPLIGDDNIVYECPDKGEISLQEFLLSKFKEKNPDVKIEDVEKKSIIENRGYYGLSILSEKYRRDFLDNFRKFIDGAIKEKRIKLRKEVVEFLEAFDFPVILTTICFNIIEEQLYSSNNDLKYKSEEYQVGQKNDTGLSLRSVYHIFGQMKYGSGIDWVHDEDSLLRFLLSHNCKDCSADGLINYLKNRRLLVIGCNLPNWLFRFLWQPAQGAKRYEEIVETKQGYWINKDKPEDSFGNFLKQKNYNCFIDVKYEEYILTEAKKKKQTKDEEEKVAKDAKEHFPYFISYASEDREIAREIYYHYKEKPWIDSTGYGMNKIGEAGEPYWENIEKGINRSDCFMPIITRNWMDKIANPESALRTETLIAQIRSKQVKSFTWCPVFITGLPANKSVNVTEIEALTLNVSEDLLNVARNKWKFTCFRNNEEDGLKKLLELLTDTDDTKDVLQPFKGIKMQKVEYDTDNHEIKFKR